jgi:hypothetical protein
VIQDFWKPESWLREDDDLHPDFTPVNEFSKKSALQ